MILRASIYTNAALLILCLLLGGLWRHEVSRKHDILASIGKAQLAAEIAARKHEQADAANSAKVAQAYEQGKQDAQAAGKAVADGLRAGNLRLRRMWSGCEAGSVSSAAANPAEPADPTQGRADSAGRIIAATHDDAEKVKALQGLLRMEREHQ